MPLKLAPLDAFWLDVSGDVPIVGPVAFRVQVRYLPRPEFLAWAQSFSDGEEFELFSQLLTDWGDVVNAHGDHAEFNNANLQQLLAIGNIPTILFEAIITAYSGRKTGEIVDLAEKNSSSASDSASPTPHQRLRNPSGESHAV